MLSLQSSLRSVGNLLALHTLPLPDKQYGFCVVSQAGKGVTLQVCSYLARAAGSTVPHLQYLCVPSDAAATTAF